MDCLGNILALSGLLQAFVFLLLIVSSESKRFKVIGQHHEACAMVDTEFAITFSLLQDGSKPVNVKFNQDFYKNYVLGDCRKSMAIHMGDAGTWNFHVYISITKLKDMLHRSVSFRPDLVFGKTAPSNETLTFQNPEDSPIGPGDCSYICPVEEKLFYNKTDDSKALSYSSVDSRGPFLYTDAIKFSQNITYAVLVDVKFIQIQVSHVHHERFGPPISCIGDHDKTSHQSSFHVTV